MLLTPASCSLVSDDRPVGEDLGVEAVDVPLLVVVGHAVGADERLDRLGQVLLEDLLAEVGLVEDLVAQRVDHLALRVHDLVVLEDVLADLAVLLLDGGLRPLDRLGDHLRLERHVVGQGLAHHPVDGAGGEQAHEVVLERQVEAALARDRPGGRTGRGAGCRCGGTRGARCRARRGRRARGPCRPRPCVSSA